MDGQLLEKVYQENLDERIISHLSETKGLSLEAAMDFYYRSQLAKKYTPGWRVSSIFEVLY